jgi:hypothetical protein
MALWANSHPHRILDVMNVSESNQFLFCAHPHGKKDAVEAIKCAQKILDLVTANV